MKFGMLHLFENPVGKTEHEVIHEQLELMRAADDLDFDSIWPAEHHFTEYGYCASPALSLAAVAQTTKRVRLGTGIVVLPLNHPLRVAEDFAVLDHMSNGRVDLGVGRGYQPLEFQRYGVEQTTTRTHFHEALQVILQAWNDGRVNFRGEQKTFTADPESVRDFGAHLSMRVKPTGVRITLWRDKISNLASVEEVLGQI